MKTYKILFFYILLSFLLSYYAIYDDFFKVAFNYDELISSAELFNNSYSILISLLIYFISYFLFNRYVKSKSKSIHTFDVYEVPNNKYQFECNLTLKRNDVLILILQVIILTYLFYKISTATNDMISAGIVRILESKFSQLLCIIQTLLYLFSTKKLKSLILINSVIVSLLFAWFDGSRAAIVPLSGIILSLIVDDKKFKVFILLIFEVYFFILAVFSRIVDFEGKFSTHKFIEINFLMLDKFTLVFMEIISYMTSFSIMQFTYVVINKSGIFTLKDLIYSILPVPSPFLKWMSVTTVHWGVDAFRPMGALSQIYRVSELLLYVFFVLLAYLSVKIDNVNNNKIKLLLLSIFSLVCVSMFQYNLRSVQWFIWLIIAILFFNHYKIKVNKKG